MANDEQKKCAHLSCKCVVTSGEKYCSQLCKDLARMKWRSPVTVAIQLVPSS